MFLCFLGEKKKLLYSRVTESSKTFSLEVHVCISGYYYLNRWNNQLSNILFNFLPRKMYVNLESGKSNSFDSRRCLR